MRTNDLKALIQTKLLTKVNKVYFEVAQDDKLYPHAVFNFRTVDLGDLSRNDYIVEIDVWDKGSSTTSIDSLCDDIEDMFNLSNLPQNNILPTFYRMDRKGIEDPDKSIKHRLLKFQVQTYDR